MEIKFRGLNDSGKNWYYGLLSISRGLQGQPKVGYYISNRAGMPWAYKVIPETVGQYINVKDDDKKEIYKDDILANTCGRKGIVIFEDGCYLIKYLNGDSNYIARINLFKIVGNKFQNPKLLKEGN